MTNYADHTEYDLTYRTAYETLYGAMADAVAVAHQTALDALAIDATPAAIVAVENPVICALNAVLADLQNLHDDPDQTDDPHQTEEERWLSTLHQANDQLAVARKTYSAASHARSDAWGAYQDIIRDTSLFNMNRPAMNAAWEAFIAAGQTQLDTAMIMDAAYQRVQDAEIFDDE